MCTNVQCMNSLNNVYIAAGVLNVKEFKDLIIDLLHTTTTRWGNLQTKLDGYVGFDTVLEQQRKKFLKKGFEFNLMVVGMHYYLIVFLPCSVEF